MPMDYTAAARSLSETLPHRSCSGWDAPPDVIGHKTAPWQA